MRPEELESLLGTRVGVDGLFEGLSTRESRRERIRPAVLKRPERRVGMDKGQVVTAAAMFERLYGQPP